MLSDNHLNLAERIRFHYEQHTNIANYMDVRRVKIQDFEIIPYLATAGRPIPEKDSEIDDLAQNIGNNMADFEFSYFISSLKKISCKTIETTLDNMVETLDQTYDELWDLGFNIDYLFMPWILKSETRKRKQSTGIGINFSTQSINPILANELGHGEIIFANNHSFGKTYPMTIDEQVLVSSRNTIRGSEIDCHIVQNTHFRNLESMRKIIVTDVENSELLNS